MFRVSAHICKLARKITKNFRHTQIFRNFSKKNTCFSKIFVNFLLFAAWFGLARCTHSKTFFCGWGTQKYPSNDQRLKTNDLKNSSLFIFFCIYQKKVVPLQRESIICTIMPSAEVQKLIPQIQAYLATQPVERAYLFGSCSRGEERPDSDVDLLVTYTDSDKISLMDIGGMVSDLRKIVHRPVDLIEDEYLMPFARKTADHDKIKIYERAH